MASSLSVLGGHMDSFLGWHRKKNPRGGPAKVRFLDSLEFPRPDSVYGASKVFGEALCRHYADKFGLSCVCLRLAEVRPDDRPRPDDPLGYLKMCLQADFVAGVQQALKLTRTKGLFRTMILISDDYAATTR
jgi:nucleoside-diphosphate-sugar epimerase